MPQLCFFSKDGEFGGLLNKPRTAYHQVGVTHIEHRMVVKRVTKIRF